MSRYDPTTNFKDSNGVDLGKKLVTKDYLIDVYPSIGQQIGIPPELLSWGSNINAQLGTNDITDRLTPVPTFAGGTDWKQVSSGSGHTAAIKTDGTLWTWGNGTTGQLGNNAVTNRSTPVTTFAGGTNWKQVSVGANVTAAIKTNGTLWVWGNNFTSSGTLGINASTNIARSTPVTTFAGGTNWKQVSAGYRNMAAVKTNGTLWTWGGIPLFGLGFTQRNTNRRTPVTTLFGGTDWSLVTPANQSYIALKTNNTLWSLGPAPNGNFGQIYVTPITTFAGGNNWKNATTEEPEDLYTITANVSGGAIKTDGTLWMWGLNDRVSLGNNFVSDYIPTPITTFSGGTTWATIDSSTGSLFNFTAAIKTNGTLWTWGYNISGQLGNNASTNRSTPVTTFAGGTNWKQVGSGFRHMAAIKTDGTLWTWGAGFSGQLGNNQTITNIVTPVTTFAGGTNWKQVSAGDSHTAAIKTDGTLWTWGVGTNGRLGNNAVSNSLTPVTTFAGGTNWKQVSAGQSHTAAVKTNGTLWTWGNGTTGQLGNNATTQRNTPIQTSFATTNWKQVSAGDSHIAAIKTDGTLWTWGNGTTGQLGNNAVTNSLTPVTTFAGGNNWVQVHAGLRTTFALSQGILYVFGYNINSNLGNPDYFPNPIFGSTTWKQISGTNSLNFGSAAAIKTDGTLWTWGNGGYGKLGTNDSTNRFTPVTTFAGGNNWKQVGSGYRHKAAIKTDGTLWTWGVGTNGRLGTNDTTQRNTPVTTFAGGTNWKQVSSGTNHTAAIKSVDF